MRNGSLLEELGELFVQGLFDKELLNRVENPGATIPGLVLFLQGHIASED